jgi:hypothetical protein
MLAVVAEQEKTSEPTCNTQFSKSSVSTGDLIESRVFFCRESLNDTDVISVIRFTGTLDSILSVFKKVCSIDLDSSFMGSGDSSLISADLSYVVSNSGCKILEDTNGSASAFDYLCDSYTEHRYPFLVVTRKTPATAYKNYTNKFTYTLGTPVTNDNTEFTRSGVLGILDNMSADDLVSFFVRRLTGCHPKQ